MKRKCIDIAEMLDVLELPPNHPQRLHLEECPRCASLLASLKTFLDISIVPAGADLENADRRLSEAVEKRIVRARRVRADRPALREPRPSAVVLDYFRRRLLRPIMAVAVIAIVWVGVRMAVQTPHVPSRPRTLRGETAPAEQEPVLDGPRFLAGGGLHLSWRSVERAQTYRVVFYRADMSEVASWETGPDSHLLLDAATIEPLAEKREPLFWGVTALRGPDEISRSPIRIFLFPE